MPVSCMRAAFCLFPASRRPTISTRIRCRRALSRSSCSVYPMTQIQKPPIRVLLEMRPALGGHAGIPQATRLLFRSLALLDEVRVEGLLQTHERVLSPGLPPRGMGWFGGLSTDQQLNRL